MHNGQNQALLRGAIWGNVSIHGMMMYFLSSSSLISALLFSFCFVFCFLLFAFIISRPLVYRKDHLYNPNLWPGDPDKH